MSWVAGVGVLRDRFESQPRLGTIPEAAWEFRWDKHNLVRTDGGDYMKASPLARQVP